MWLFLNVLCSRLLNLREFFLHFNTQNTLLLLVMALISDMGLICLYSLALPAVSVVHSNEGNEGCNSVVRQHISYVVEPPVRYWNTSGIMRTGL